VGLISYLREQAGISVGAVDEQRALPRPDNELPLVGAYTATTVTPAAALAIGDVWAAVRVLADAASSLPLHVYRHAAEGRERVTGGALVDLLDRPAPATTQADLVSSLMAHLAIYGNAYWERWSAAAAARIRATMRTAA
jgi:phage portal protein BeeE